MENNSIENNSIENNSIENNSIDSSIDSSIDFLISGISNIEIKNKVSDNNSLEKQNIINLFLSNVKGKEINLDKYNSSHSGKEGHWLENQMNIKVNQKNLPDINGFEMKKETNNVTTFIDKVPSKKLFIDIIVKSKDTKTKIKFWNMFGSKKQSDELTLGGWKINKYDNNGQILVIDKDNNIQIIYDYKQDKRENKEEIIDAFYKLEPKIIIQWNIEDIKKCIDNKFNCNGFFICKKNNKNNTYNKICFGKAFTFEQWINDVKKGKIYYDGYSKCFGRWRGCFRANNIYWNSLLIQDEEY